MLSSVTIPRGQATLPAAESKNRQIAWVSATWTHMGVSKTVRLAKTFGPDRFLSLN